ncbi:HEAT repeat domain-containing protein [Candidatus Uabimicrobium sp. HlEnr_7]|uniref:HEAT repeat domain-containing protein n=1 Tax=Candidatus Uabimicrobium helgolandensis TaxID=3095367 RepID=UPI00355934C4
MKIKLIMLTCLLLCTYLYSQEDKKPEEKKNLNERKIQQVEAWISDLEKWPSQAAKRSLRRLYNEGEFAIPFLLVALKESKPNTKEACAECLGKMEAKEAFSLISSTALEREMRSRISTLFRALILIDKTRAYPVILDFLKASTQTSRYPAFLALAAITKKEHLPLLKEVFASKYAGTRKYIVDLASRIEHKEGIDFVIEALEDPAVQVAYKAAEILGTKDSDVIRNRLLDMVNSKNKRLMGYVTVAVTMQEDTFNLKLFSDFWIPRLLLLVRYDQKFVRGAAAVGLVNIGFQTDNREIIELMNKQLAPVLIESVMGRVYYQDYAALRKIAYTKLKQLTGQDFGYSDKDWWGWWHQNNGRFEAIRLLKGFSVSDIDGASISYRKTGGPENESVLFVASTQSVRKRDGYDRVIVLDEEDMIGYLNHLKEEDFFKLETVYGTRTANVNYHVITVKVKNLVKEITSYDKEGGVVEPLISKIKSLERNNVWQLYWDNHSYPQWLSWYRLHKSIFRRLDDEEDKNLKLKEMIVNSYGWLKPKDRLAAARLFHELMEKDQNLPNGAADLTLLHIRTELELNDRSVALIKGIALSRKEFAITKLVEYLIENYSARARTLIKFLLTNGSRRIATRYLKHGNPTLRSVAVEALAKLPKNELTNLYLLGMLNDESREVKQSVIFSLGELKVKKAVEPLTDTLQNNRETAIVNAIILKALAKIQEEKSLPILLGQLQANNESLRISVAQALGNIKSDLAIKSLVALMNGDSSREVCRVAAVSLSQIGNNKVTKALLKLAHNDTTRTTSRVLALQTLQRYQTKRLSKSLRKLLKSKEEEVRIETAFLLTKFWEKKAIPIIIEALDHPRHKFSARKYIVKLTFVRYELGNIKRKYNEWWEQNKKLPIKHWLFSALRKKKYNVVPLLDYLIGNKNVPQAFPLLLKVLEKEDWYLQSGACFILEDLTGQNFGDIQFYVGVEERRKVVDGWKEWYQNSRNKNR